MAKKKINYILIPHGIIEMLMAYFLLKISGLIHKNQYHKSYVHFGDILNSLPIFIIILVSIYLYILFFCSFFFFLPFKSFMLGEQKGEIESGSRTAILDRVAQLKSIRCILRGNSFFAGYILYIIYICSCPHLCTI